MVGPFRQRLRVVIEGDRRMAQADESAWLRTLRCYVRSPTRRHPREAVSAKRAKYNNGILVMRLAAGIFLGDRY